MKFSKKINETFVMQYVKFQYNLIITFSSRKICNKS